MRKAITVLLVLLFVLSAAACTNQPAAPDPAGSSTPEPAAPAEPADSSEPAVEPPAENYSFFWSATSASSGYYPFNVAIADIINQNLPNVTVTVLESGGMSDNLNNLENNQAQMAQGSEPDLYLAQQGIDIFEGEPYEKPRLLFLVCPLAYYFTVNADSDINTLADLDGADYSPGLSGSSTELLTYRLIEDVLGYKPKWYPASTGEAVNSMKDRRIQGFTKSGATNSADSSLQDVATSVPIRILSFTQEEADKVAAAYPYYRFTTVDGSLYGLDEDIYSVASFFCTQVSADVPEEVVYNIITACVENQDYIAQSFGGIRGVDFIKLTAESSTSLMHPGLVRYLTEQGYTVRDEQIPPEMR